MNKGMLCIDLTPQVVGQAMAAKAQLIVAYHPPIFEPLSTLSPVSWKHEALLACVKGEIAIFSPHTALDAAPDGLNDWLASGGGCRSASAATARGDRQTGDLRSFA